MSKTIQTNFASLLPLITEAIERGNHFTFTAFGNSMKPYIRGGKDRVTLSPFNRPPKIGDVLFYRRKNGVFVLHRVVKVNGNRVDFCGDNQVTVERNVDVSGVIAILTAVERNGKVKKETPLRTFFYFPFVTVRRFLLKCMVKMKSMLHIQV